MKVIIGIVLFVILVVLVVFGVGGVIWMFVQQHLEFKRYIEWLNRLDELKKKDAHRKG